MKKEQAVKTETAKSTNELNTFNHINEMCIESLSPETFEKWEDVKKELNLNRSILKNV